MKLSAMNPVKQHRRSTNGKDTVNPRQPLVIEAHVFHDVKHGGMFDRVEGFSEVQLEENYFFFGRLALINIFKCPRKAILDRSPLDKSVLISMDYLQNNFLEAVGKDFGDYLETTIE